jgi:hypothetical protein
LLQAPTAATVPIYTMIAFASTVTPTMMVLTAEGGWGEPPVEDLWRPGGRCPTTKRIILLLLLVVVDSLWP